MRYCRLLVAVVVMQGTSSQALCSIITLIPDRASMERAENVDWAKWGPAGKIFPQPFTATTNQGYHFPVQKNNSKTQYIRADEGNVFQGVFLPGEPLLYSTSLRAFDMRFDPPIR